jgi:hypothetical protein
MRSPLACISLNGDCDKGWNRLSWLMTGTYWGLSLSAFFLPNRPKSVRREVVGQDEGTARKSGRVDEPRRWLIAGVLRVVRGG